MEKLRSNSSASNNNLPLPPLPPAHRPSDATFNPDSGSAHNDDNMTDIEDIAHNNLDLNIAKKISINKPQFESFDFYEGHSIMWRRVIKFSSFIHLLFLFYIFLFPFSYFIYVSQFFFLL